MQDDALLGGTVPGNPREGAPIAPPRLIEPATFNINHRVRIRITPAGHAYLKRTGDDSMLTPGFSTAIDETTGLATWQLWEVMATFGPAIHMGCAVPFETEIELVPER